MSKWFYTIVAVALLMSISAEAQIAATLDGVPDTLQLGDPVVVTIEVSAPATGQLLIPDLTSALGDFELLSEPQVTSEPSGDLLRYQFSFKATCYKAGDIAFQAIPFGWQSQDGSEMDSMQTDPALVYVQGVLPDSIIAVLDTTQAPHKLLEPNRLKILGYTFWENVRWVPAALGIGLLAYVIYLLLKRRKRKAKGEEEETPPPRPAHEIALEALDALKARRLFQEGRIKDYYSELSGIVRQYIEGRYDVPALESTSFQLLREVEHPIGDMNLTGILRTLLHNADMDKFAKSQPEEEECRKDLENAYVFVNKTTAAAPAQPAAEEGN